MRRYPAYDPPEYQDWTPDPAEVDRYRAPFDDPDRRQVLEALDEPRLLDLYRHLLRTRLHDIGLKRWVRTGVISKAWLGTGEEAVTVGAVAALDPSRDVVCPMIRNAGALPMMGMPLSDAFRGYLASADSPSGGRDLHIGDMDRHVLQPISHMGTNVAVMAGVALSFRLRGEDRVALTWIGDGATKTAACHEGLTFAAVRRVPAVFVVQNNQVALGTRASAHGNGSLAAWARAYGMPCLECDGNNVLDVFAATTLATRRCRAGEGPVVVLAETFRMGGHATHDEREARDTFPAALFEAWGRRDPVGLFEAYLGSIGADPGAMEAIEVEVTSEVDKAAEVARASRDRFPTPDMALYDDFSEGFALVGLQNRPIDIT
ncbi:MAG TPA: thiamine pyrophosphate-dependent dehydrogenase E1 component subunit alpha [Longimicrobiales bacterium]|nr:thiamine pyrophosphate-dependent dehydrogenase E1 component subunit alpha [Longimicrobiales bacterium]